MKVRDNSLCREWERRRRDRLAIAFKFLAELLPNHDPAKIPARIDILDNATQFIKQLRLSNSRLVADQTQPAEMSKKVRDLQDEVNKLVLRVKQLTVLLVKAKISIPNGPSIKVLGRRIKKWSKKLNKEDVENFQFSKPLNQVTEILPTSTTNALPPTTNRKTIITVVENISDTDSVGDSKKQNTTATESTKDADNTLSLPKGPLPHSVTNASNVHPPAFILTPIQIQPQILTRINLTPTLQHPSILSKVIVPTTTLQKIPIKVITKRVPKKIRKPRVKVKVNRTKKGNGKLVEFGTQTAVTKIDCAASDAAGGESGEVDVDVVKEYCASVVLEPEVIPTSSCPSMTQNQELEPITIDNAAESICMTTTSVISESSTKTHSPPYILTVPEEEIIPSQNEVAHDPVIILVDEEKTENQRSVDLELEESAVVARTPTPMLPPQPQNTEFERSALNVNTVEHTALGLTEVSSIGGDVMSLLRPGDSNDLNKSQLEKNGVGSAVVTVDSPTPTVSLQPSITRVVNFDMDLNDSGHREVIRTDVVVPEHEPVSLDTEKIGECIARSIGLMEAGSEETEAELMELGTDWGDVVGVSHSPKSPISPTQMFLSMFPLLPRENLVAVPVAMDTGTTQSLSLNAQQSSHSQHHKSSFFIDSMLPGQGHASSVVTFDTCNPPSSRTGSGSSVVKEKRTLGDGDSLDTILAPLQPLNRDNKRSDILSFSAFLHSSVDTFPISSESLHVTSDKSDAGPTAHAQYSLNSTTSSHGNTNSGGGFYQTENADLFLPSYSHHKGDTSTTYLHHPFSDLPSSSSSLGLVTDTGTTTGSSFSFRHNYSDNSLENIPQAQRQPHNFKKQVNNPNPVLSHAKGRNAKSTSGSQLQSVGTTNRHQKSISNPVRPKPSEVSVPFPYFQNQNLQQPPTTTKSSEASIYHNSRTSSHAQNVLPTTTPPFRPHFYSSSQQSGSTTGQRSSSTYFGNDITRSIYAPQPPSLSGKDTPFYVTAETSSQPHSSTHHFQVGQPFYQNSDQVVVSKGHAPYNSVVAESQGQPMEQNKQHQDYAHQQQQSPRFSQPSQRKQQPPRVTSTIEQTAQKIFEAHANPPIQNQRPVNWMTDSPYKKTQNTFSVSKLVGVQNQSTTYDDAAVIRQNRNPWNDLHFGVTASSSSQQQNNLPVQRNQYQHKAGESHPELYVSQVEGQRSYDRTKTTTHHHHFHPTTQNQNYFNPPHHHHHHQPLSYPGTTSTTISNFNLSSIFPEINDKGHAPPQQPYGNYGRK